MTSTETSKRSSSTVAQNLLLLVIPILSFPACVIALFYNFAALVLRPQSGFRHHVRRSSRFRPQKVIITGIATPAGLRVARAFHHTGHNVIGVEEGAIPLLNHARWSKAVSRFYSIRPSDGPKGMAAYKQDLIRVVYKENAKLWIDCSRKPSLLAQAETKRVLEEKTSCVCLTVDDDLTASFESRSEFQQFAQQLGLPTLETHSVRSRNDIHNILTMARGKKYLLSSPNGTSSPAMKTILPRRTVSQTYQDVAGLKLLTSTPWVLEEYIEDLPRYTAWAVVVHGRVKAFAASSASEPGSWKSVPATSGLNQAMKQYMEDFAAAVGDKFSTHLTMEFCLDEKATHLGVVQQILPVDAHLASHETVLLFGGKRGSIELTKAYMAMLASTANGLASYTGLPYSESSEDVVVPADPELGIYVLFQDLMSLFVGPLVQLVTLKEGLLPVLQAWLTLISHLVSWQEATYEFGDPLPAFWYVYVHVPSQRVMETVRTLQFRVSAAKKADAPKQKRIGK